MNDEPPVDDPADEVRTIFVRASSTPAGPDPVSASPTPAPARASGRLQPGDVLNGIYEVRRFVAAGGMGEVWEGVSIHSDERVAIKVMLPHLAQDPNVVAMFRKEAATLTRLAHPALVSYRMLAMEPVLGVLYIVTDYVDGRNLADVIRDVPRDPATLRRVLRRLAEGLLVAHEAGAVHRDLSPDNVLLEGGDIGRARIIDFGIAKDLDSAKGTIIGDGFAGKLGYVAPEQLGDFGREIGPWTDVYSLGLVALAIAGGTAPDMGMTLVDAVDRRRGGVDVSVVAEPLRGVVAAMLRANPAKRLRGMDAVIAALDAVGGPGTIVQPPASATASSRSGRSTARDARTASGGPLRWIAAATGTGVLALGAAGWWATRPPARPASPMAVAPVAGPAAFAVADPLALVRAALPQIDCTWLDARSTGTAGGQPRIEVTGAAGDTMAVQRALSRAAPAANIDASSILHVDPKLCPVIDALRQVRATGPAMLSVQKQDWELDASPDGTGECQGRKIAKIPALIDPRAGASDWGLSILDPVSGISPGPYSHAEVAAAHALTPDPDGRLRMSAPAACQQVVSAWLLIRGAGPYAAAALPSPAGAARWQDGFLKTARARHWTVELA